jgi:hypothetical protein
VLDIPSPDTPGTLELTEWSYQVLLPDGDIDWMDVSAKDPEGSALRALEDFDPAAGELGRAALYRTVTVTLGPWQVASSVGAVPVPA